MVKTIFATPQTAGFFGFNTDSLLAAAAEYLLPQYSERRLRWLDKNDEELVIWLRCTCLKNLSYTKPGFLEVSSQGGSDLDVTGGNPSDLLAASREGRLLILAKLINDAADAYEEHGMLLASDPISCECSCAG